MNEKTGTGVSYEKEEVIESQSRSVTPSLDTPSGVRLGASHYPCSSTTIPGSLNFSFPNLVSKIPQCDTWCSDTPIQLHVLYTFLGRGVTEIVLKF